MNVAFTDSRLALLALAEVQAAVADFNQGDTNIFDALDRIRAAVGSPETADGSQQEAA